jgi:hypothetical protein
MKITNFALIAALTTACSTVMADEKIPESPGSWNFEGSFEFVGLDSDSAAQEGIKDSANAIGFYANYLKQDWLTSLRGSYIIYSDEAEFSQLVEHVGGFDHSETKRASSEADALTFGVAFGRRWQLGSQANTDGVLQLGFDQVFGSDRSISNCSNCYSEDIDIDGGVFVQGGIRHNFQSFSAGVSVTRYLTGDGLTNRLSVTIGNHF